MAKKTYTAEDLADFNQELDKRQTSDATERRFYLACFKGDLDTVIQIKNQIDITSYKNFASFLAVRHDHLDVVKYLHAQGVDIHNNGYYLVLLAAHNGHLNVVKYLHEQGADIRAVDDYALRYAAENGHLDVVKYLHEHGADIRAQNDSALFRAALNGHLDVVQYLYENGADIHADNDCAVRWAAESSHVPVVQYILSVACDFDIVKRMDVTDWTIEHFKEFFSLRFMMQNPFVAQRVWDIVPQDQKTPAVIQHYQQNIKLLLLRNPLQQKLAVG